jgi:hypothetical protein
LPMSGRRDPPQRARLVGSESTTSSRMLRKRVKIWRKCTIMSRRAEPCEVVGWRRSLLRLRRSVVPCISCTAHKESDGHP